MAKNTPAEEQAPDTAQEAAPEPAGPVLATRVETFSVGEQWGYRAVDNNGSIARESAADYDTQTAAIKAARDDTFNEGLTFVDAEVNTPSRFAWQ